MLAGPFPPVIDRYASPEALAEVANAPISVCELIFIVTAGDRRHLELFRNGLRLRSSDEITTRERYAVVWVARSFTHSSFPQIGRAMAMDHSSIIRAYNRAKLIRRTDRAFRAFTDELARKMPRRHRVQKRARDLIEGVRP